jgi:hypothetical protein
MIVLASNPPEGGDLPEGPTGGPGGVSTPGTYFWLYNIFCLKCLKKKERYHYETRAKRG